MFNSAFPIFWSIFQKLWIFHQEKFLLGRRKLRRPRKNSFQRHILSFWKRSQKIGNAQLNIFSTASLPNTALTQLQINLFLVASSKFLVLTQLKLTWFLFWLFLIRSCKLAFSRRVGVRQSNLTQPNLTWWPFLQPLPLASLGVLPLHRTCRAIRGRLGVRGGGGNKANSAFN